MGPAATGRGVSRDRRFLKAATLAYLVLLPVGHLAPFLIAGARATWSDVLLAAGVLELGLGGLTRILSAEGGTDLGQRKVSEDPVALAAVFLLLFAAWVLVGSGWSYHPRYAAAKGMGAVALAVGVVCIRWSDLPWRRAADAWLVGAGVSVLLVWVVGAIGPDALRGRLVYPGGMVYGLPFPRISGPFGHPNLFGDYLVLSGVLLWARWPAWWSRWHLGTVAFAGLLGLTLVLTASTAWLGAGVLILLLGVHLRRRAPGDARSSGPVPWLLIAAGVVVTVATLAGVLFPLDVRVGPLELGTGGIRPRIWASAAEAFFRAPLVGVGASPYLAQAAEPAGPAHVAYLWDAHSAYLSVLGQYGIVGAALVGGGLLTLTHRAALLRPAGDGVDARRIRPAILAGLLALAVHGTVIAGEDFRHWWAWLGVVGLAVATGPSRVRAAGMRPGR